MRAKTTHRTAVTVLFFTIVLCLLTAGGCKNASKRAYRAYSGTVSVSLGLGREGILVEEHPFPVTVHVDGDYAKEGSSCVLTVPTNASDYYAYRKPLSDENEQTISFIVPAAKYSSQITIELLDSYERVIYSRTCTYQAYDEWQNMLLAGHMGNRQIPYHGQSKLKEMILEQQFQYELSHSQKTICIPKKRATICSIFYRLMLPILKN